MNTNPNKKLTLTRETLRTLTSNELRLVAGGALPTRLQPTAGASVFNCLPVLSAKCMPTG